MKLNYLNTFKPQNEYIEEFNKRFGKRFDHEERKRKAEARSHHAFSQLCKKTRGIKAKLLSKRRYSEKAAIKQKIAANKEKSKTLKNPKVKESVPAYLLDREKTSRAKVLSNTIKQKRKEKAGRWDVPLPKVKPLANDETFKVIKTGKRRKKSWKRLITKATFVGESFTRLPPKYERFIRPSGLRFKKAHVTHPELQATFQLKIIGVKKNPQSNFYTNLGVITKGTIIEVNVSELGLVTTSGKVVWGKYAQVTNNPELDGCINSVLLV